MERKLQHLYHGMVASTIYLKMMRFQCLDSVRKENQKEIFRVSDLKLLLLKEFPLLLFSQERNKRNDQDNYSHILMFQNVMLMLTNLYYRIQNLLQTKTMLNIDESESINLQNDRNQFLEDQILYETCPYCTRRFFQGKLVYHLKLCNYHHPMLKSPQKSINPEDKIKNTTKYNYQQNKRLQNSNYQICQFCQIKFPAFLMDRHKSKCQPHFQQQNKPKQTQILIKTKPLFNNDKKSSELPKIRNSAEPTYRRHIQFEKYSVKVRDQLRCMRMAMEVQKVTCESCGRKFSNEAALRHIPICQHIKLKEQKSIALKKKSRSLVVRQKDKKYLVNENKSDEVKGGLIKLQVQKQKQKEDKETNKNGSQQRQ